MAQLPNQVKLGQRVTRGRAILQTEDMTMDDMTLRQNVLDELDFEPSIDATDIGVAVKDGTVTLTGHVRTYAQRVMAEEIVRRVNGVRAIAEEIEVRPMGTHVTADDEIAKRVVQRLDWNTSIPAGNVKAKVENGWVTMTGRVEWHYQKDLAAEEIRHLTGVTGVTNQIEIKQPVSQADVQKRIEEALKRDAEVEARAIKVRVADSRVTLEGKVRTWAERQAAERAAWSTRGVANVVDNIAVTGH
jgi:osmotically-inducible protein OsmY